VQGAALSAEKVLNHLNDGFDPLVDAMNEQLTKLGGDPAPLAEKAAQFILVARERAKDALFEDFKAAAKLNALKAEVQKTIEGASKCDKARPWPSHCAGSARTKCVVLVEGVHGRMDSLFAHMHKLSFRSAV
jgi:hypothetical protein